MWSEIGSWPAVMADALKLKRRSGASLHGAAASHAAIVVGLALTVAACSSIDSMFGDEPAPTVRSSSSTAPAPTGSDKDYPKLSTVPERPQRPTPPPQQGLAADRSSARYADNEVRPVNEAAGATVGQRLSASAPPQTRTPSGTQGAAAQPAAAQPGAAQPGAAPVSPVQAAPTTPMQQPVQPQASAPAPQAQPARTAAAPAAAPMPAPAAPMPAPVASSLPPPPAPSQQALVLPPTTRPAVSAVAGGRPPAAAPTPVYTGNNIQVAVVQFGRASSGLSSDDLAVLRDVAEIQKKQGGIVRVVGHASQDTTGSDVQRLEQGNYQVSLARANAIAAHLTRLGVPRQSIVVEAAGDLQPEYDPVTPVAVASNRRAEIFLAF